MRYEVELHVLAPGSMLCGGASQSVIVEAEDEEAAMREALETHPRANIGSVTLLED